MTKITDFLEKLDLSELEAKLYLTLLESGPQTVRDLAKRAGIGRTTSYPYIDLLLEKGLIMKNVKGVHTYVVASPPQESLKQILDQKTKTIQNIQKEFPEIISELNSSRNTSQIDNTEIRYYKGKLGVKKVYEEAVQSEELRSYAKIVVKDGLFPDNVEFFNQAFKKNENLSIREIIYDSPLAQQLSPKVFSENERYDYKFMPPELKLTSEDILIYNGKVAIINYKSADNINCIILQSKDYYNNSKELFDYIWKMIPSRK